ncbi:hypothetical protein ACFWP5_34780 [Streptomyces sp. NPDC058469]|uniref:hypothetical protein n=1 Tax=Streptomyces sp. NPDC058469 TaxID=3346514 RepID=UPI003666F11B
MSRGSPYRPPLLTQATTHAVPAPRPQVAPGDTISLPIRDALAALTVQDESRAGYKRSKSKHWTDADNDGRNRPQRRARVRQAPW